LFTPGNRAAIGHNGPDHERLAAERERVERMLDALFALAMAAPAYSNRRLLRARFGCGPGWAAS
jgi:hypothetical protein